MNDFPKLSDFKPISQLKKPLGSAITPSLGFGLTRVQKRVPIEKIEISEQIERRNKLYDDIEALSETPKEKQANFARIAMAQYYSELFNIPVSEAYNQYAELTRIFEGENRYKLAQKYLNEGANIFEGPTPPAFSWDRVIREAKKGFTLYPLSKLYLKKMRQGSSPTLEKAIAEAEKELSQYRDLEERGPMLERLLRGPLTQVPRWINSGLRALDDAVLAATAWGTAAAIVGQLGPQVTIPEEAVTVPVSAGAGFVTAFVPAYKIATLMDLQQYSAGMMYRHLSQMRDDNGNPLDPTYVAITSELSGLSESLTEMIGISTIWKGLTGQAVKGVVSNALVKTLGEGWLAKFTVGYGTGMLIEISQEEAQEGIEFFLEEIVKGYNNATKGTEFKQRTVEDLKKNLVDTFGTTVEAFALMMVPSAFTSATRTQVPEAITQTRENLNAQVRQENRSADVKQKEYSLEEVQRFVQGIEDIKQRIEADVTEAIEKQDEKNIINPIDRTVSRQEKARQLRVLSELNIPRLEATVNEIRQELGLDATASFKRIDRIIEKSQRADKLASRPWYDVEHIRDALRFKAPFETFQQLKELLEIITDHGFEVIKLDIENMIEPNAWGWRLAGADVRAPNGQLIEFQAVPIDLENAKRHDLYEAWRDEDVSTLLERDVNKYEEYRKDLEESNRIYAKAWNQFLDTIGLDADQAKASWRSVANSVESSLKGEKLSFRSSAEGGPSRRQVSPYLNRESLGIAAQIRPSRRRTAIKAISVIPPSKIVAQQARVVKEKAKTTTKRKAPQELVEKPIAEERLFRESEAFPEIISPANFDNLDPREAAEIDAMINLGFDDFIKAEQEAEIEEILDRLQKEQAVKGYDTGPFTEENMSREQLDIVLNNVWISGYAGKGISPIVIGYIKAAHSKGGLTQKQYETCLKHLNYNPKKYRVLFAEAGGELTADELRALGYEIIQPGDIEAELREAEIKIERGEIETALVPVYQKAIQRFWNYLIKMHPERGMEPSYAAGEGIEWDSVERDAAARDNMEGATLYDLQETMREKTADTEGQGPPVGFNNLVLEFGDESVGDVRDSYERLKDVWIGNRDIRVLQADVEADERSRKLLEALDKKRYDKEAKDWDAAIQLYIDLKRNPAHVTEFSDKLTDRQKQLIERSQRLPAKLRAIADEISQAYAEIGKEAEDMEIIHNVLENYAARVWDLQGKETAPILRRFGTKTHHAKQRVFETIVEGWAAEYNLKVEGAIQNLFILTEEISKTIEDKRFLKALLNLKTADGNNLITTYKPGPEYLQINHPHMKTWRWSGKLEIKALRTQLETLYEESTSKAQKETEAVEGLKNIVRDSLILRGFTENEANNAIAALKNGESAAHGIEIIEKRIIQKEKIIKTGFYEMGGRNYIVTEDGNILERLPLYAPKKIATNLNRMLDPGKFTQSKLGTLLLKFNAVIKGWLLLTSFFHHLAFMRSYYLPTGRKRLGELTPRQAYRQGLSAIKALEPEIVLGVRKGLTLGLQQDWAEDLVQKAGFIQKLLNKTKATKAVKDFIMGLRQQQTDFLFGKFGAGLKAKVFLIEFRNKMKKNPNRDPEIVAASIARLVNDDFGGLHLMRLGRSQTAQQTFRLLALAPDWTESNVRTMVKAIFPGMTEAERAAIHAGLIDSSLERRIYQRFWMRAITKGIAATAFLNFVLAGGDPEEWWRRYMRAWEEGPAKMRWLDLDITPIYEALQLGEYRKGQIYTYKHRRKYFSLLHHFKDPFKFIVRPIPSARAKASIFVRTLVDALTQRDWAGRQFTTFGELIEDWKTVAWRPEKGNVDYEFFPSFIINELTAMQPIQMQNLIRFLNGEMEAFDAILNSAGLGVRTTYENY